MSFALQKLLSFRRTHLFIVALIVCATRVLPRKWSPVPMSYRLLPTFSSIRFNVVRLMLRSLIHLDLSFVHGDRYGSTFILLQVDVQLCQHHLLKMLFFLPLYNFSSFVKNQVFIGLWIKIWVFDSIPLVNISAFVPISRRDTMTQ